MYARSLLSTVCAGCLCCWASLLNAADSDAAVLHWQSGDSLPGHLAGIDADTVQWQSPLFAEPLRLQRSALRTVQYAASETPVSSSGAFRVGLHDGDVLFGNLAHLDADVLELDSARHGRVRVPVEHVSGVDRVDDDGLIFLGPNGTTDWISSATGKWTTTADGAVESTSEDGRLKMTLPPQQKLSVEVVVTSPTRCDLVLSVGTSSENSLRLETWDDVLVGCSGLAFEEVLTLPEQQNRIHLLLYFNLSADDDGSEMLVCHPSGKVLTRVQGTRIRPEKLRLSLQNGAGTTRLEQLTVRRWNGTASGRLEEDATGVQLLDGRLVTGNVITLQDGNLIVGTDGEPEAVPLTQVGALRIAPVASRDRETPATDPETEVALPEAAASRRVRLKWRDGGRLTAELLALQNGVAQVRTVWHETPFQATTQGLQTLQFPNRRFAARTTDELIIQGRLLHGQLNVSSGDAPVSWQPAGALSPVPLRAGDDAVITRGGSAESVAVDRQQHPDMLFLTNGDVLPCRLLSMQEQSIRVASPFAEEVTLPAQAIRALELSSGQSTPGEILSFASDGWRRIRGRYSRQGGVIQLGRTGSSMGHEAAFEGGRMQFVVRWPAEGVYVLAVHLYVDDLRKPSTRSSFSLVLREQQVAVSTTVVDDNPFIALQHPDRKIITDGSRLTVRVAGAGGKCQVWLNGEHAATVDIPIEAVGNRGALFQLVSADGAGNPRVGLRRAVAAFNAARNGDEDEQLPDDVDQVTLSQFSNGTQSGSGSGLEQFLDEITRRRVLTIPRFRRDDPATHALLAPNGDILRGRLLGLDDQTVRFESRLEKFHFPRERVAAIVWIENPPPRGDEETELQGPADHVPQAVEADRRENQSEVLQTVLQGGILVSLAPQRLEKGRLYGQSPLLGDCSVPAASISRLYLGNPEERQETAAWSRWQAKHAMEPDWDIPTNDGGTSAASAMIGQAAPDIELAQLDGTTFRLSEHRGKVVVLDFWATWCGPCVAALPDYIEATQHFEPDDLIFVAVNLEEAPQQIRAFLAQHPWKVRVALDRGAEVAARYQVTGIPHSVIVSPEGTIEWVHVGYDPDAGAEVRRVASEILDGSWQRGAETESSSDSQ